MAWYAAGVIVIAIMDLNGRVPALFLSNAAASARRERARGSFGEQSRRG
jgi:hypothetical protein